MKVLIVSTRYLGDCLIAAGLAAPIKTYLPEAEVHMLTFESNRSILEGVQGIDHVIGVKQHPKKGEQLKELMSLRNHYDWAIITMQSTRACLYGYFAGKKQSMPKPDGGSHGLWKRWLMSNFVEVDHALPMIDQMASLLEPLIGKRPAPQEVPPACPSNPNLPQSLLDWLNDSKFVVFHTQSRYRDKSWSDKGWRELTLRAIDKGYKVCFTGGPGQQEAQRIAEIVKGFDERYVRSFAGLLSFGQTGSLIEKASCYVGVDTGTTHVAAATGTPCVTLFGPTDPIAWGPSPKEGRGVWRRDESLRQMGNVIMVRNANYLDCHQCDRHRCPLNDPQELGHCLQTLETGKVVESFESILQKAS